MTKVVLFYSEYSLIFTQTLKWFLDLLALIATHLVYYWCFYFDRILIFVYRIFNVPKASYDSYDINADIKSHTKMSHLIKLTYVYCVL